MNPFRAAWHWLSDSPQHVVGIRVLESALGAMLIFRGFTELPFAAYFWGPDGLGAGRAVLIWGLGPLLTRLLNTDLGATALPLLVAASGTALLFGWRTRIACAVALASMVVMEHRLAEVADGGDNIARLALIYLLFVLPAGTSAPPGSLRVWFHNLAVIAIAAQLVTLYLTSGFLKAYGEKWHNGTALYYISQVEWFSLPGMRAAFKDPYLTTLATYATVAYQVMFPVAMLSRLKPAWIFVGVCFHAGIAIFMGLLTFSTVMVGLEVFLFTDREFARMRALVGRAIPFGRLVWSAPLAGLRTRLVR